MNIKWLINPNRLILLSLILGVFSGLWGQYHVNQTASAVSQIFINLLKLVSTPIIFLSILSTVSGMNCIAEFKNISKKLIRYTLFTTYLAAFIAFLLYLVIDPANMLNGTDSSVSGPIIEHDKGYLAYFIEIIPSNIITPFSKNNVMGVLFLAILFSMAALALPDTERATLHKLFSSLNALFLKVTTWIIYLIPVAIWSFITLFIKEMQGNVDIRPILLFLLAITTANLIQGLIILPIFIKSKGISPFKLANSMLPALSLAFFSKSSSATLPMTMCCAESRAKMPKELSNLAFPLCTAINMNGCAAFIFTTVLFVSMSNGLHFSLFEMFLWTFIATIAAIGNAGVPMGCYFLSTAFLAAMNVPLNLMAIILPFYALIDMLETSLNVWSDACVVAVVDKELQALSLNSIPNQRAAPG